MTRALCYAHVLSPLHVTSGQSLAVIDRPLVRERATRLPYVPAAALWRALRAEAEMQWRTPTGEPAAGLLTAAFGPPEAASDPPAGTFAPSDLRLLFFPLVSVERLFAYVTSPYLVQRFLAARADALGPGANAPFEALCELQPAGFGPGYVADAGLLTNGRLFLDDADLPAEAHPALAAGAAAFAALAFDAGAAALFLPRVALVSDALMGLFVEQATDVVARIQFAADTQAAAPGGLFYLEALPAESVLYATCTDAAPPEAPAPSAPGEALAALARLRSVQVGGRASVGAGLCRLRWEVA